MKKYRTDKEGKRREIEIDFIMNFGKYKGESAFDLCFSDKGYGYLIYLIHTDWLWEETSDKIEEVIKYYLKYFFIPSKFVCRHSLGYGKYRKMIDSWEDYGEMGEYGSPFYHGAKD